MQNNLITPSQSCLKNRESSITELIPITDQKYKLCDDRYEVWYLGVHHKLKKTAYQVKC